MNEQYIGEFSGHFQDYKLMGNVLGAGGEFSPVQPTILTEFVFCMDITIIEI